MRNLKKSLCLVLALVFVLGLCTVGVGAANGTTFSDQKEIQYDTAVKAMSGLGILIGNDDNGDGVAEFSPKGTLTRAAAAKMIAYMVLGLDADKYPKIEVFSDVTPSDPSTWWAAPYIAFCQSQGIIAGMGDGTFRPSAPVTQAQFAKMLLAACGYNGKKEFEGAGWDQNVAKVAMQTRILQNLNNVDWDGAATREEAALLTYNTMMKVAQVVLSKDTDDYKLKDVNGGNFGAATWKLDSEEGYVIYNKANKSTAKGIELNTSGAGGVPAYFYSEDDAANATMLGHYVKITYRIEQIKGEDVAVVYFVEDNCTEKMGLMVVGAEELATAGTAPYVFVNGDSTTGTAYTGPNNLNFSTYVLNADGKIIAKKTTSYFLTSLTSVANGKAKFLDDLGVEQTVDAPEGAKAGDTYTVTKMRDVFTLEPCTKQTGVKITERSISAGKYVYNDGKVASSNASNLGTFIPTDSNLRMCTPTTDQLKLSGTYTLYFDAKGKWYAYSDEVTVADASSSYVYVVQVYVKDDTFGNAATFAQVIKADGTIENALPYGAIDGGYAPGVGAPVLVGDVFKYSFTGGVYTLNDTTTIAASTTEKVLLAGTADGETFTNDPKVDYSSATYVYQNGLTGSYLKTDTAARPAAGTAVWYTYRNVTVGTTPVKKVETVWFATAAATAAPNSYIYVVDSDVASTKVVGSSNIAYYTAFMDGVEMEDLAAKPFSAPLDVRAGKFATYVKDANGYYTLSYIEDITGPTALSEASVYLTADDVNATGFILNGKLYDNNNPHDANSPLDLSNVKVVRLNSLSYNGNPFADRDISDWYFNNKSQLTLTSVAAIEAAVRNGYGITVIYVNIYDSATNTNKAGGGTIYVVGVK